MKHVTVATNMNGKFTQGRIASPDLKYNWGMMTSKPLVGSKMASNVNFNHIPMTCT